MVSAITTIHLFLIVYIGKSVVIFNLGFPL